MNDDPTTRINDDRTTRIDAPVSVVNPRATVILALAALGLTIAVLTALVAVVLGSAERDDTPAAPPAPPVTLIGAQAAVAHPFTPSIAADPVPISEATAARAAAVQQPIAPSAHRGIRPVSGRLADLYGTAGDTRACDEVKLANYLDAHPDVAAPWGLALGLTTEQLPYYLNTLTPVVLLGDTWVSLHSHNDQTTTAAQAVLAAGTAVMVDGLGVPRVRCESGNPLSPPANTDLRHYRSVGPGFDPARVLAVRYAVDDPGPPLREFTLLDLTDAHQVTRAAHGIIDLGGRTVPLPDPVVMNVAAAS